MAVKVTHIIVIAALIAATLSGPPVRIDEQHLHVPRNQGSGNGWQDSVPGLPGQDYPNLSVIPKTSFTCADKTPGGYYADVETRCQVFHVCNTEGTKSSFLCPSGSIFNQRHFVCDWWYDFECERAPDLYSLNDALDDHESTSDQSDSDRHSPGAPLPYNSIGASNNDLSLASSGYPNNIRDEANLIYEDYASGKINVEADGNSIPEKSTPGASSDSIGTHVAGAGGGASALPVDNHSTDPRRLNAREQQQSSAYQRTTGDPQPRNSNRNYRGRPSQPNDNVPRGFSNSRAEDPRNDNGPGFFVNNGLIEDDRDKHQGKSNFTNNQYNYESDKNKEKYINSDNNANNVRYGIYYQNPEKYPLPQENNNYANSDSNKETKENNDYNKNEINSNHQYSSNETFRNHYSNSENYAHTNTKYQNQYSSNETFRNHYANSENIAYTNANYENQYNSNDTFRNHYPNSENIAHTSSNYENLLEKSVSSSPQDYTSGPYNRILEYGATTPRAISSAPTEDEVDREWQRAVDSTELRKNSPQRLTYDYESSASFLAGEESRHPWREDLTTSSSGSPGPPYPPESPKLPEAGYSSDYGTSTLARPEESTLPTGQERPKFLGRRPPGGLLSGAGNGLPGASKVLAGSAGITGKPAERSGYGSSVDGPQGNDAWDAPRSYLRNDDKINEFAGDQPYWNKQGDNGVGYTEKFH